MKGKTQQEKIDKYTCKLGHNLMCIRMGKGIVLSSISIDTGISVYTLHNIEKGKYQHIRILVLFRLAKYYHVMLSGLFEGMD